MPTYQTLLATATEHYAAGRHAEAERAALDALAQQADGPDARHIAGLCAAFRKDFDAALQHLEAAVAARGDDPELAFNAARITEQAGRHQRAGELYHLAVRLAPEDGRYWHRFGRLLSNSGQRAAARPALDRAATLLPDDPAVQYSRAVCLNHLGENAAAKAGFERVLSLQPDHYGACINLGAACLQVGALEEAREALLKAIRLEPEKTEGYSNLGTVMMRLNRWEEAAGWYRKGLDKDPDAAGLLSNMAIVMSDQGRHREARAALERAIEADRSAAGPWDNFLFAMLYDSASTPEAVFRQHKAWGQGVEALPAPALPPFEVPPVADRRLRVGFLSPDFCHHPVGHFIAPVIERLNASGIDPVAFAQTGIPDAVTQRVREASAEWYPTNGLSDAQIAALARQKRIDIMVDLAGHTNGNRLRALALCAAPVQVSYLGYPATTGLSRIDWRLTDRLVDPPEITAVLHTEKLWHLPNGFLVYDPPREAPAVSGAPVVRNGHITFGSFNNLVKLSERTVSLWASILKAVPGSRLLLKSRPLGDPATAGRVAGYFGAKGIARERLDLRGRTDSFAEHLAMYGDIDIALDPVPYNGTTTSFEALWMGVPIVALAGPAHVSRVTASLLLRLGRRDLIARDDGDYVARAVRLAGDPQAISAMRQDIRGALERSPMTDVDGFAGDLAAALHAMWRKWCVAAGARGKQKAAPADKTANEDGYGR